MIISLVLTTTLLWSSAEGAVPGRPHALLPTAPSIIATLGVTESDLSRLASLYLSANPEFHRLQEILRPYHLDLAVYGGTSREIIEKVIELLERHRSVAIVDQVLRSGGMISYLDWHRLGSDLDVLFVQTNDRHVDLATEDLVRAAVTAAFPSNTFYKSIDVIFAKSFFLKFSPGGEHFEAISNIPIMMTGIAHLPPLKVEAAGKTVDLVQWGVRQYLSGQFDCRLNRSHASLDAYAKARQYLRWVRYISAEPTMTVTDACLNDMLELKRDLETVHRAELIKFLEKGHQEYPTPKGQRPSLGAKLLEALEKMHLYSKDSLRAEALFRYFGLAEWAHAAGIDKARIYKALPERTAAQQAQAATMSPRGGSPLVLRHRTRLSAAQNISLGALWLSDNDTIIGGKRTLAVQGPAIYAAEGTDALGYGDIYVSMTLSPTAVKGVDYTESQGYYAIKTRQALMKDEHGRLMVEPIQRQSLLANQMQLLRQIKEPCAESQSLILSIATLLQPDLHPEEEQKTVSFLHAALERLGQNALYPLFSRPEIVRYLISGRAHPEIYEFFLRTSQTSESGFALLEHLMTHPADRSKPDMSRLVERSVTAIRTAETNFDRHMGSRLLYERPGVVAFLHEHYPKVWAELVTALARGISGTWRLPIDLHRALDIDLVISKIRAHEFESAVNLIAVAGGPSKLTPNFLVEFSKLHRTERALMAWHAVPLYSDQLETIAHQFQVSREDVLALGERAYDVDWVARWPSIKNQFGLTSIWDVPGLPKHTRSRTAEKLGQPEPEQTLPASPPPSEVRVNPTALDRWKKASFRAMGRLQSWWSTKSSSDALPSVFWANIIRQLNVDLRSYGDDSQFEAIINPAGFAIQALKRYRNWPPEVYAVLLTHWKRSRRPINYLQRKGYDQLVDLLASAPELPPSWREKIIEDLRISGSDHRPGLAAVILLNRVDPPEDLVGILRASMALARGQRDRMLEALNSFAFTADPVSPAYGHALRERLDRSHGVERDFGQKLIDWRACEINLTK